MPTDDEIAALTVVLLHATAAARPAAETEPASHGHRCGWRCPVGEQSYGHPRGWRKH